MSVSLTDRKKRKHKYPIGFSFGYFFLGPFYLLFRKKIFTSFFLLLLYYWLLPIKGLREFCDWVNMASWLRKVVLLFGSDFMLFCGIFIIFILHIILSINIEKILLSEAIEKSELLPSSDKDASILAMHISKYSDLPVHPSYVKKITFIDGKIEADTMSKTRQIKEERKLHSIQNQLDILYEKYNSGFISQNELLERQREIVEEIKKPQ